MRSSCSLWGVDQGALSKIHLPWIDLVFIEPEGPHTCTRSFAMEIGAATTAQVVILGERSGGCAVFRTRIPRQTFDSIETRTGECPAHLLELYCRWMGPENQPRELMDTPNGIGGFQTRPGEAFRAEPALVQWPGRGREPASDQCPGDMRSTGDSPLQFLLQVGDGERNPVLTQPRHSSHDPLSAIRFQCQNPIPDVSVEPLGEIGEQVEIVIFCTTCHLDSGENSKTIWHHQSLIGRHRVVITDGDTGENAAGSSHDFCR